MYKRQLLVTRYRKLEVGEEILKNNKHLKRLGRITGYLKEHYTCLLYTSTATKNNTEKSEKTLKATGAAEETDSVKNTDIKRETQVTVETPTPENAQNATQQAVYTPVSYTHLRSIIRDLPEESI